MDTAEHKDRASFDVEGKTRTKLTELLETGKRKEKRKFTVVEVTMKRDNYDKNEDALGIEVNGDMRLSIGPGEPEDMYLHRDLAGAFEIIPLLQEAYEAGKRGEEMVIHKREMQL